MTVAESITFVRLLLDEPKYEYFGTQVDLNTVFRDALREAAAKVTRECWYRGEKEAIRPLWRETQLTLGAGQNAGMPGDYMFIESVRSNYRNAAEKQWAHKYVSPNIFMRRRHRTPFENQSGTSFNSQEKYVTRAEYTLIGNDIYATSNTAGQNIVVTYISVPTISSTLSDGMPLAEYIHPKICEQAAEILYRKEHPGDDRPAIGGIYDIEAAIYSIMRQGQK